MNIFLLTYTCKLKEREAEKTTTTTTTVESIDLASKLTHHSVFLSKLKYY
jgi:hypothetical protein